MERILTLGISAPVLIFPVNKMGRVFLISSVLPQSVTMVSFPGNFAITIPAVIDSLWKTGQIFEIYHFKVLGCTDFFITGSWILKIKTSFVTLQLNSI